MDHFLLFCHSSFSLRKAVVLFVTLLLMRETEDNATVTEQAKNNLSLSLKFHLKSNYLLLGNRDPKEQNMKKTT